MRDSLEYSDRMKSFERSEFSAWDNFWLPFKLIASVVVTIGCFVAALYLLFN